MTPPEPESPAPRVIGPSGLVPWHALAHGHAEAVLIGTRLIIGAQMTLAPFLDIEAREVIEAIAATCRDAGGALTDLVQLTVSLTEPDGWTVIRNVISESLAPCTPALTVVQVESIGGSPSHHVAMAGEAYIRQS